MNSKYRHSLDSLLQIESGVAAHTTVGDNPSTGMLDLLTLTEAYWDNNEIAVAEEFTINIDISDADDGDADETYVFQVQIDAVTAFDDNPVTVLEYTHVRGTTGLRPLAISRAHLADLDYEARYLRLNVVGGGTTPSITYTAYVSPVVN